MDMPIEAQRDTSLPVGARFVLWALWRYAGREKRFVWPSAATLATDTGFSERTVQRHLTALENARWIERDGRGWVLCDPPGTASKHGESPATEPAEDGESTATVLTGERVVDDSTDAKNDSADIRIFTGTNQEHSLRERENASPNAGPTPPVTEAERESETRRQIARFRERSRWGVHRPTPPGGQVLGVLIVPDRHLRELLEAGETVDSLLEAAKRLSARVSSGELPPRFWGPLAFTGYFSAVRDGLAIDGVSKPVKGPSVDTVAEAEAWAREHAGRLPDGWEWQPDGHGHHEPVRRRGA